MLTVLNRAGFDRLDRFGGFSGRWSHREDDSPLLRGSESPLNFVEWHGSHRQFDRQTNPVAEVIQEHPSCSKTALADFDELHSRLSAGGR